MAWENLNLNTFWDVAFSPIDSYLAARTLALIFCHRTHPKQKRSHCFIIIAQAIENVVLTLLLIQFQSCSFSFEAWKTQTIDSTRIMTGFLPFLQIWLYDYHEYYYYIKHTFDLKTLVIIILHELRDTFQDGFKTSSEKEYIKRFKAF